MKISSALGAYQAQQIANAQLKKQQETADVQAQKNVVENKLVEDRNTGTQQYDLTNMHPEEMQKMASDLWVDGKMSIDEFTRISIETHFQTHEIVIDSNNESHTRRKASGPVNYIEYFQKRLEESNNKGDIKTSNTIKNILDIFDGIVNARQTQRIDERV